MLANILIILVAFLHLYFLILEMFLWTKPFGLKVFRQSLANAQISAPLAKNQGLYNGFLAAGLFFGLYADNAIGHTFKIFFLSCVAIAGVFGAVTVNKRIFLIQGLPAILALAWLCIASG